MIDQTKLAPLSAAGAPIIAKIAKSKPTKSRRVAREIALRAIYLMEMRDCQMEEALQDPLVLDGFALPAYSVRLVSHTQLYREQLDEVIKQKLTGWEFHRIAVLDRLILRISAAELIYFPDVPPKVSINEAIEIAKCFSTEKSGKFINGILDAIMSDVVSGKITPTSSNLKK